MTHSEKPVRFTIIFNQEDTPYQSGILDASSSLGRDVLSFAEMLSPKKQLDIGLEPTDVECKENFTLMTNTYNQRSACVFDESSEKFTERGWKLSMTKYNEILRLS